MKCCFLLTEYISMAGERKMAEKTGSQKCGVAKVSQSFRKVGLRDYSAIISGERVIPDITSVK